MESARQKEEAPITATTIESSIAKVTNMMTNFWNLLLRMTITVTGQEEGAAGESLWLRGEGDRLGQKRVQFAQPRKQLVGEKRPVGGGVLGGGHRCDTPSRPVSRRRIFRAQSKKGILDGF